MILVIDVGNTNTVMGVYDGEKLFANWRISTSGERTSDETGLDILQLFKYHNINVKDIEDVIISSVVPQVMYALELAIQKYLKHKPLVVDYKTKTGINILYDKPKDVGADRIVNAVAALAIYGGPIIVVDFGTATTFCAIDKDANYIGGVICAGIKISMDALFARAAKLPRVELARPDKIIGSNTVESMQSGAIYGFAGQVDYIISKMREEMGGNVKVIATGGLANLIIQESKTIVEVNRKLTLEGLRLIYDINKKDSSIGGR